MDNILAKRKTYAEVLEAIALSPNTPTTITCRPCGQPMQLLKINNQIGYWLHHGKAIQVCAEKNTLHPGHPMIAQNMKFYRDILSVYHEIFEDKQDDSKD